MLSQQSEPARRRRHHCGYRCSRHHIRGCCNYCHLRARRRCRRTDTLTEGLPCTNGWSVRMVRRAYFPSDNLLAGWLLPLSRRPQSGGPDADTRVRTSPTGRRDHRAAIKGRKRARTDTAANSHGEVAKASVYSTLT